VDELTEFDDSAGMPNRTRAARPERARGARAMDGASQSHPLRQLINHELAQWRSGWRGNPLVFRGEVQRLRESRWPVAKLQHGDLVALGRR
jgi:hypothetical protein